ncbi:MAG: hypothetical protein QM500_17750 [Methylococcales bacterium]
MSMSSAMSSMKPSECCKLVGLKSLVEMSDITSESVQTLNNWFNKKPIIFDLILRGIVMEKQALLFNDCTPLPDPSTRPSEYCKAVGLKSLVELGKITSEHVQTLGNWLKNKPYVFSLVVRGALMKKQCLLFDSYIPGS